jgi:DNA-binding NarL/FixJ family response regulator
MNQINIVVSDDHAIVRMGLKAMLHQHSDLRVVGEASTSEEAIEQTLLHKPDIVVMDIRMPIMSSIDACRKIINQLPNTQVIFLTAFADDDLRFAAINAGAVAYVLKRIGQDDLVQTIRRVAGGQPELDKALNEAMFKHVSRFDKAKEDTAFDELSKQELRILVLLTEGSSNRDIAGQLFLSDGTVRNYVSSMLGKLHVANRAAAAAFATGHNAVKYLDENEVMARKE